MSLGIHSAQSSIHQFSVFSLPKSYLNVGAMGRLLRCESTVSSQVIDFEAMVFGSRQARCLKVHSSLQGSRATRRYLYGLDGTDVSLPVAHSSASSISPRPCSMLMPIFWGGSLHALGVKGDLQVTGSEPTPHYAGEASSQTRPPANL